MIEKNFIQKSDSTYRQAQLLSPLMYLILESICKEIYNEVHEKFDNNHSVYSGDISKGEVIYDKKYNQFYKEVNKLSSIFTHYIKFDIKNFYRNIDLNILFDEIEENGKGFTQFQLYIYKQFIEYCGEGLFPIIENSTGLSYIATKIYLSQIDKNLKEYLDNFFGPLSYKIIRYVDDLYIFFDVTPENYNIDNIFVEVKNYYMMILRERNLEINTKKSVINPSENISQDLQKSFYDGQIYDDGIDIHKVSIEHYIDFLKKIREKINEQEGLSLEGYQNLIKKSFKVEGVELLPKAIYNYIIYNYSEKFEYNSVIIKLLNTIVTTPIITYDIKLFVLAILHTKDGDLIKKLLNHLFKKDQWSDVNNHIAIVYLLQRNFRHNNLKLKLKRNLETRDKNLYKYINIHCESQLDNELEEYKKWIDKDSQQLNITANTMHIYFLYLKSKKDNDYLLAYAYYKSFFDRITAEIVWSFNLGTQNEIEEMKAPNYKGYYHRDDLKRIYKNILNSKKIINRAHKIRNSNPIIHSKAELTRDSFNKQDLKDSIYQLNNLINSLITEHLFNEN